MKNGEKATLAVQLTVWVLACAKRKHVTIMKAAGSRGCRRSEERNRSPHSFEQELDFDAEGSSQLGRRMSMTNYVGNDVKDLIRQTLKVIRSLVNNEQDPPASLLKLNMIAEREKGWLLVVESLIETVPDDDSLGPAVITLFLDECPLPSKDTVHRLLCSLRLDHASSSSSTRKRSWHRNTVLSRETGWKQQCGYVQFDNFKLFDIPNIASLYTSACGIVCFVGSGKIRSDKRKSIHDIAYTGGITDTSAQVITPNRTYAYETTDVSKINAMLNHEDVSEYLKIGPDGLEARCDVSSFESVRCTFAVQDGVWFYEATVFTPGVMQIGFATKRSRFLNHEGYGIGDDESSVAYDGCRQLLWHNAHSSRHEHEPWSPGNRPAGDGVFAAASFMSFQQCRFNFGAEPFKYPPDIAFRRAMGLVTTNRLSLTMVVDNFYGIMPTPVDTNMSHGAQAKAIGTPTKGAHT
ncbi:SPRY domain protein [Teladorsagia circumcincta]|uniref:SPRY domain protein n=1 Tax=Teladorsagia circumcincta TaxID=45464 RepID=A0A2G9UXQ6_TELCI|nr:SPRY domain protein [Teladorsagia circumcincta]